jgi:MFS family permease
VAGHGTAPTIREIFARASWRDPALSSASQAGMVNNLNDGLAWGLFPLFFAAAGLDVAQIGILSFTYPAVWGLLQLWTGALSDRWGRKRLIAGGMLLQSGALAGIALLRGFWPWVGAAALLGVGTAMVYPTLLAAVGDVAHPRWRASAVGVYRLWRDSGYAVGALLAGVLADLLGMEWSIGAVALLTFASGLLVVVRMPETLARYVVEKGSISVDGISLTVTWTDGTRFSVALIPHTLEATTLGRAKAGNPVNLEVDVIAKYVEGMLQHAGGGSER